MDLFEYEAHQGPRGTKTADKAEASEGNMPEFTVSELSGAVKTSIETGFSHVKVRAEVGRVSRPRSGHLYLDLKDDRSVLASVIWKGRAQALQTPPEEGMEVIATGKLTTFPGQSKYQMVIEYIAPAGVGALMAMLEKRKAQFAAEGLFAPERKQKLPYLPQVIGVVTSPSGAVIRDILHRLRDRFPRKVLVWPVAVQGQHCAAEVARAIEGFNALTPGGALPRPDVLIVARGGGSLEDLWGFNEEVVVRAAAASRIPLISAVGHETDTTLIDFVSDQRAPTPTAAAELSVPVRMELLAFVNGQKDRLLRVLSAQVAYKKQRFIDVGRALPRAETLLEGARQRCDVAAERLPQALRASTTSRRVSLLAVSGGLRPAALSQRVDHERSRLQSLAGRHQPVLSRRLREQGRAVSQVRLNPPQLEGRRERVAHLGDRLHERMQGLLTDQRKVLSQMERLHETLGYKETLRRGYAVIKTQGRVITKACALEAAPSIDVELSDGTVTLDVAVHKK